MRPRRIAGDNSIFRLDVAAANDEPFAAEEIDGALRTDSLQVDVLAAPKIDAVKDRAAIGRAEYDRVMVRAIARGGEAAVVAGGEQNHVAGLSGRSDGGERLRVRFFAVGVGRIVRDGTGTRANGLFRGAAVRIGKRERDLVFGVGPEVEDAPRMTIVPMEHRSSSPAAARRYAAEGMASCHADSPARRYLTVTTPLRLSSP